MHHTPVSMALSANAKSKGSDWFWQKLDAPSEQAGDRVPNEVLERTPPPEAPPNPTEPRVDALTGLALAQTKANSDLSTALEATSKTTPVIPSRPEKGSRNEGKGTPATPEAPVLPAVAAEQAKQAVAKNAESEELISVATASVVAPTEPSPPDKWDSILESWHLLLQKWSLDGSLEAAAREALMLDGPNAKPQSEGLLQSYISQWSARNFENLPEIVFLSKEDMNSAMGAYAASTGTIYINAEWANQATQEQIHAVLTEEHGHYLDGVLNETDTQGDEGEIFTKLLAGDGLSAEQKSAIRMESDSGYIFAGAKAIETELALSTSAEQSTYTINQVITDPTSDQDNILFDKESNSRFIYIGGNDTYWGGNGIDELYAEYFDKEITLTQNYNASYTLQTLAGVVTFFDIEYLALKNTTIRLDPLVYYYTYIDSPGNQDDTFFEGANNYRFVYNGGNDILGGGQGLDGLSVSFLEEETTLNKIFDDSYVLTTPTGTLKLYDFEYLYFTDTAITLDSLYTATYIDSPGSQDDTFFEGANSYRFVYNGGNDIFGGGQGLDGLSVNFLYDPTKLSKTFDESYALTTPTGTIKLYDFEYLYFTDTAITLDSLYTATYIDSPGSQDDTFFEGANNYRFVYNGGNDIFGGGQGLDGLSVNFLYDPTKLSKTFDESYALTTPTGTIKLYDFEYLYFTDTAITLDSLYTATYIDSPGSQDDTFFEGANNYRFVYNGGNDLFSGGIGFDGLSIDFIESDTTLIKLQDGSFELATPTGTILFSDFENLHFKDKTVKLGDTVIADLSFTLPGTWENLVLVGDSNINGTGNSLDNSLTGNSQDNILIGDGGNDILLAGDGDDEVYGGAGGDLLIGGSGRGDDRYDGGDGVDTVKYTSATLDIVVNLATGFASGIEIGNDTLSNIENVIGGQRNDLIIGTAGSNVLDGFTGDDTIHGGGGNDILIGGEGNDTAVFSNASTSYIFGWDANTILISDSTGTTRLSTIENLQFSDRTGAVNAYKQLNLGKATFSITGASAPNAPAVGNTLIADTSTNDPDGNGNFIYTWQTSLNGTDWSPVGTNLPSYSVAASDAGKQIRLLVAYTDLHGFIESVTTSAGLVTTTTTVTLAVSPTSVTEDGTANLIYTFTRTGATTNALTVNYTIGGTATLGTDYTGISASGSTKTISFAAGSTTATVTINPTADTTIETNETVALTLATGTGYTIGTTTAVSGTITNDDFPAITLAVSPTSVTEDGTANLVYTFTRTGLTTNALTVNYTVGGTATLGTDYTGISANGTTKTISFAAGSTTATVTINPTADTTIETNETVALTLATGTGYTISTTTAVTGTITNDDISSSTSRTLTGTESSLLLTSTKSINGTGNNLDNSITGNSGNNTLNGGLGNDTLTGGLGSDTFRFDSVLNGTNNVDKITDFAISQGDRIQLENTGAGLFTAITTTGTLATAAFISGTAFTNTTQRIRYESGTGNLFYDSDGNGASGSILFATLSTGLAMTNTQLVVT